MTPPAVKIIWWNEFYGGLLAAIVSVPPAIAFGSMALGQYNLTMGIQAGLIASIVGGLCAAWWGSSPLNIAGPRAAGASALKAVLVITAATSAGVGSALPPEIAIPWLFAAVALAGLVQMLMGAMGLGVLITWIPAPVRGGITNGIALLILVSQIKELFKLKTCAGFSLASCLHQPIHWGAVAVALTAALVGIVLLALGQSNIANEAGRPRFSRLLKRMRILHAKATGNPVGQLVLQPEFVAIFLGVLGHYAWQQAFGNDLLGPTLGALHIELMSPTHYLSQLDFHIWQQVSPWLFIVGVLGLAVIASLDSLISANELKATHKINFDHKRELIGHGLANVASGLMGGLTVSGSLQRANIAASAKSESRWAGIFHSLILLLLVLLGAPWLSGIPQSVMAGVMIIIAWRILDRSSLGFVMHTARTAYRLMKDGRFLKVLASEKSASRQKSKARFDPVLNAGLTLSTIVMTVLIPLWLVLGLGLVSASMLLMWRVSDRFVTRTRSGSEYFKTIQRTTEEEHQLLPLRKRIVILELKGDLFFGNASSFRDEVMHQTADIIILDFKRVHEADATGAGVLLALGTDLKNAGKQLVLTYVQYGEPLWKLFSRHRTFVAAGKYRLSAFPGPERNSFDDNTSAIEALEDRWLAEHGEARFQVCAREDNRLFHGLSPSERDRIIDLLAPSEMTVTGGTRLFDEGHQPENIYLICEGRVALRLEVDDDVDWEKPYVTLCAGTFVGMLEGMGDLPCHYGEATAVTDCRLYAISLVRMNAAITQEPAISLTMMRNALRQAAWKSEVVSEHLRLAEG